MNSIRIYNQAPLLLEKPKILIIEVAGMEEMIKELESFVYTDIDIPSTVESFFAAMKTLDVENPRIDKVVAKLSLRFNHPEYDLCQVNQYLEAISFAIFKKFMFLQCYQNNNIPYCFGGLVFKDTIMLWKPNKRDIDAQS